LGSGAASLAAAGGDRKKPGAGQNDGRGKEEMAKRNHIRSSVEFSIYVIGH